MSSSPQPDGHTTGSPGLLGWGILIGMLGIIVILSFVARAGPKPPVASYTGAQPPVQILTYPGGYVSCSAPSQEWVDDEIVGATLVIDHGCGRKSTLTGIKTRVKAQGTEATRQGNALLNKAQVQANIQREEDQRILERTAALRPQVIVRTVLVAPAPPVYLIPRYTVVGPWMVQDKYGHVWSYQTGRWLY